MIQNDGLSTRRMNVLFLAAEAEPFIKVGGLGDVAGSLPRALRRLALDSTSGVTPDVRLVLPLHQAIRSGRQDLRALQVFSLRHSSGSTSVRVFAAEFDGMPVYLLDAAPISNSGTVYATDAALDGSKYLFFSLAALELARVLEWPVDLVHANDWHTALALYALHLRRRDGHGPGPVGLLTLHNLPFMGPPMPEELGDFGLGVVRTGLPDWAATRPLALGLWAADAIVAVSPAYAREIQGPASGSGLDHYLHARSESIHGILNGIDVDSFNPATDAALGMNFGVPTLDRRIDNKTALQGRAGLREDKNCLTIGVVSRMDVQKGIDLIPAALRRIADLDWQLIVLGTGQPRLEAALLRLQKGFPERVRVEIAYDDRLARQIYAGADVLLMPSRYEPCGLAQMIAMRYGCLPLVSAVGGLVDSVSDGRTGFVMGAPTAARLAATLKRTIREFSDSGHWSAMQRAAMAQDFSWDKSARKYLELYENLMSGAGLDRAM